MYWLRRIPTETRIVVVVVFLALFQAILLSVFGLGAIRHEREGVAADLHAAAKQFVRYHVVDRCQTDLRDRATDAAAAAFDRLDPEWREHGAGGGLFTDAFFLPDRGEGIRAPDGSPLWLSRSAADRVEEEAGAEATRLETETHAFDEDELQARHLDFARRYPFARDAMGGSRALAFASTPLWSGGGTDVPRPGPATHPTGSGAPSARIDALLKARWIGVVNRVAGIVPDREVEAFLALADLRGGDDPAFLEGRAEQERRAGVLRALREERDRLRSDLGPQVHRNVGTGSDILFFVRPVGVAGDLQVLATDSGRLEAFLAGIVDTAQRQAPEGVTPGLAAAEEAPADPPPLPIDVLPGRVATTRVSRDVIRARAAERERFYWYIIAFSVAGILAGGILTARVVMREMKLAKLKSGFVSNVSHGLKTPLTSIRMFADMLQGGQVTDEAERKECLQVIAQETERLSHLIQQVLDFGRLEAKRRSFRWVTGSLAPVLAREAERFRRTTGMKPDAFAVHVAANLPPVTHDPEAIGEALSNLLSNAYKYTDARQRIIEVTLGPQRGRVVLAVEDNGPGIPPRERKKIFERFYRADDLLTREVEGTGLGLSIAANIVRAHGGRIRVDDGALGGARFAIVLPAAARRRRPDPAPAETSG